MEVDITGRAIRGLPRREISEFVNLCQQQIERMKKHRLRPLTLSIVLVDDATMKQLNQRYRRRKKTTDVLTFPASDERNFEASLGEIVISTDQASRQAREERHSLATELRYLLLHGMLHAHGYDHETDDGTMNRIEMQLRERVGLG